MQRYEAWDFEKPVSVICLMHEVDTGLDEKFLCLEIFKQLLKGAEIPGLVTEAKREMMQWESPGVGWMAVAVAAKQTLIEQMDFLLERKNVTEKELSKALSKRVGRGDEREDEDEDEDEEKKRDVGFYTP